VLTFLENSVEPEALQKLAHLARLKIADNELDEVAQRITDVLALVDQLQAADTEHVKPMAHPLDAHQRLRADEITEPNVRDQYLALSPTSEEGLFLVPKVIE
jgi:aspartyl-tRNA(Asn)/glutamyl-tRNA(Gln) amidotransferase subunit C